MGTGRKRKFWRATKKLITGSQEPGTKKRKREDHLETVLRLHFRGYTLRAIERAMLEVFGVKISYRTIYDWIERAKCLVLDDE